MLTFHAWKQPAFDANLIRHTKWKFPDNACLPKVQAESTDVAQYAPRAFEEAIGEVMKPAEGENRHLLGVGLWFDHLDCPGGEALASFRPLYVSIVGMGESPLKNGGHPFHWFSKAAIKTTALVFEETTARRRSRV